MNLVTDPTQNPEERDSRALQSSHVYLMNPDHLIAKRMEHTISQSISHDLIKSLEMFFHSINDFDNDDKSK